MHMAIVSILLMALIVFGGMSLAQSFLSSTDNIRHSELESSELESEITRTDITGMDFSQASWANMLRVRLENSGQLKLASFSKWDLIANYYDGSGEQYTKWLPYTTDELAANEWRKIGLYLNGKDEVFEPEIFNPAEEIVIAARLSPSPGPGTTATLISITPNGIQKSISFPVGPGYPLFLPHAETSTIASTEYYYLREGIRADGTAIVETTGTIAKHETGRWLLHNESDGARPGRHIYSLAGIDEIPASAWTVYYRAQSTGKWVGAGYPGLSIDISIRKADGTIRETIATDVAEATLVSPYTWQTISATYHFPGYTVADYTDYLEIDFYGKSSGSGPNENSSIQLNVDDGNLTEAGQTRIEA